MTGGSGTPAVRPVGEETRSEADAAITRHQAMEVRSVLEMSLNFVPAIQKHVSLETKRNYFDQYIDH